MSVIGYDADVRRNPADQEKFEENETKEARKSRMAGEFKKPDVISLALAPSERVDLSVNEGMFASLG
jgi:hypothetical protein